MEILRQQLTEEQHPAAPVNGSLLISVADPTETRRVEAAFDTIDASSTAIQRRRDDVGKAASGRNGAGALRLCENNLRAITIGAAETPVKRRTTMLQTERVSSGSRA
jgi:hypothetical protein